MLKKAQDDAKTKERFILACFSVSSSWLNEKNPPLKTFYHIGISQPKFIEETLVARFRKLEDLLWNNRLPDKSALMTCIIAENLSYEND